MMGGYQWFGQGYCRNGFGFGMFNIWTILLLVAISFIIIGLVAYFRKKTNFTDPLDTLKMLYVKGEITEEEYVKRKSVLERK